MWLKVLLGRVRQQDPGDRGAGEQPGHHWTVTWKEAFLGTSCFIRKVHSNGAPYSII